MAPPVEFHTAHPVHRRVTPSPTGPYPDSSGRVEVAVCSTHTWPAPVGATVVAVLCRAEGEAGCAGEWRKVVVARQSAKSSWRAALHLPRMADV